MQQVQEMLNARVAELEARKNHFEQEDHQAVIDAEVESYRAELTARYTTERDAKLEAVNGEIKALRNWLAELAETPEETDVQPEEAPVQPEEIVHAAQPVVATIPAAFQRFKTI